MICEQQINRPLYHTKCSNNTVLKVKESMQKETIQSLSNTYSLEINKLEKINSNLLKLFGTKGTININYGVIDNNITIKYVEASAILPSKEYIPYCKAIHLLELIEKLDALYLLFKNSSNESKSSPQNIIDLIEANEIKDPRLSIVKADILFLFTFLSTNQKLLTTDNHDTINEKNLH